TSLSRCSPVTRTQRGEGVSGLIWITATVPSASRQMPAVGCAASGGFSMVEGVTDTVGGPCRSLSASAVTGVEGDLPGVVMHAVSTNTSARVNRMDHRRPDTRPLTLFRHNIPRRARRMWRGLGIQIIPPVRDRSRLYPWLAPPGERRPVVYT